MAPLGETKQRRGAFSSPASSCIIHRVEEGVNTSHFVIPPVQSFFFMSVRTYRHRPERRRRLLLGVGDEAQALHRHALPLVEAAVVWVGMMMMMMMMMIQQACSSSSFHFSTNANQRDRQVSLVDAGA